MTTSSSMIDLCTVKQNFSELMNVINPWTLSHFVMWLDIKVAEYKVYGHMVLDNSSVTTPQWLKSKDVYQESLPSNHGSHGNKSYSKPQHTQVRTQTATSQPSPRSQQPRQSRNVASSSHHTPLQCDTQQYGSTSQSNKIQGKIIHSQGQRRSYMSPQSADGRNTSPQSGSSRLTLDQQWQNDWSNNQQNISPGAVRRVPDLSQKHVDSYGSYSLTEPTSSSVETAYNNHVNSTTNQERRTSQQSSTDHHHHPLNQITPSEKKMETPIVVKIEISDDSNEEITSSHEPTLQALPNFTQTFASTSNLSLSASSTNFSRNPFPNPESSITKEVETYDAPVETSTPVPVSMYTSNFGVSEDTSFTESVQNTTDQTEGLDQSWRDKKREYIQSVRKTNPVNPKAHSRIVQRTRPFPDPFPVESLKYGQKAQEMIESGIITRPAKMQFLDTVFNEIVKYTGLYPTPTQKMEVAKSIVQSFPKLNVRSKDSHISAADSWFVVLNDKFRNERRGLSSNPRDIRHSHMIRQRAVQTLRRAHAMSIIYGSKPNTESDISKPDDTEPSASQE